ncbi:Regulator of nonsense transcripts 3A [Orchesella cincta]|uniref:Regulator of nonsense transcripts 3A n=1 Tax=Orchesella cincta TaxID=48709 RepID=A0A1D2NCG9_ORCCI|nr:Regulator of nonsense transcripts 3A [Orchesella cincta]
MDELESDLEVRADVDDNEVEQEDLKNEEEEDDDESDDDEDSGGGEGEAEGEGEKWIDVRVLEQMTLDELQQLGLDERGSDANNRRLDPPITKVIVRRLPPSITIEGYLQELSEVPAYNYIRLVPPNEDLPSRIGKRSAIYINFETEQEAFWFKEKYNKMKFFDERGNSYIACVDFSFFQDISKDPPSDPLTGTLEESEVYKEFLITYEENPWAFSMIRPDTIPTPEVMLEEILNKKIEEPDSTPLLQFLRQRGEKKELARKEREVKRKEKEVARREAKDRERDKQRERREKEKERRKERDRERQREREREKRLRKERDKVSDGQKRDKDSKDADRNKDDQKDRGEKSRDQDKSVGKEKDDKDSKQNKYSGSVTYSKSGNVTRWSENSGPKRGAGSTKKGKDDDRKKSQDKLNTAASESLSEKLPVEKGKNTNDNQTSSTKTDDKLKPTFGKPFPIKDNASDAVPASTTDDKKKDQSERNRNEKSGESGQTRKRIVKKVIKVKKVVKEEGGSNEGATADGSSHQEPTESKPRKIIRVVKKSTKSDDGNKPSAVIVSKGKEDISEKGAGDAGTNQERKGESEKERKTRKGRPEIQIYRPGSLRGAGASSSKPSSSGDKDRSDNSSAPPTHMHIICEDKQSAKRSESSLSNQSGL